MRQGLGLGKSNRHACRQSARTVSPSSRIWLVQAKQGRAVESIGLFEAKTHLSELIARAERGEEVVITRHNKLVAKWVPIGRERAPGSLRRAAALDGLRDFAPIELPGVLIADLIGAGRT